MTTVSIIIATSDRCGDLRKTLDAIARVEVPAGLAAELVVVDNASRDATAEEVHRAASPRMPVRYIREERRGKCNALNTALAAARGDILLFTDDDVRPGPDWIGAMCRPILAGEADAVAGRVRMAAHLERPWMTRQHHKILAVRDGDSLAGDLIGANAAVARRVFEKVPGFEPELGPGALGFGDDTLFVLQLGEAGYRCIVGGEDTTVEHHFQVGRLTRAAFLESAVKRGRSKAFLARHWGHGGPPRLRLRLLKALAVRALRCVLSGRLGAAGEGISLPEYHAVQRVSFLRHLRVERRRPPKYRRSRAVDPNGTSAGLSEPASTARLETS